MTSNKTLLREQVEDGLSVSNYDDLASDEPRKVNNKKKKKPSHDLLCLLIGSSIMKISYSKHVSN